MTSSSFFRVLLALFGLALCISISAAQACAGVLLLWWIVEKIRYRTLFQWQPTPLNVPLWIFFGWSVLVILVVRPTDFEHTVSSFSGLLLFFWASQRLHDSDANWLFRWICIGAAVAGFIGIVQLLSRIHYYSYFNDYIMPDRFKTWPKDLVHLMAVRNDRAVGPRSHPLTYAECLMPAFFLIVHSIVTRLRERPVSVRSLLVSLLGLVCVAGGVLGSQTRGVWMGLLAGCVAYAALSGRRFFLTSAAVGLVAGGVFLAAAPASVTGRLLSVVSFKAGTQADQESKQVRFQLWTQAWENVKQHPVLGVGINGVQLSVKQPMEVEPRIWTETHNMYLQTLLELGVVGVGLFLWVLIVAGRLVLSTSPTVRPALMGMFVAFLLAGLTESWPHDKEVAMLFWLFLGCAAVLRPREER